METSFWIVFWLGVVIAVAAAQTSPAVERGSAQWKALAVVALAGFVLAVLTPAMQYRFREETVALAIVLAFMVICVGSLIVLALIMIGVLKGMFRYMPHVMGAAVGSLLIAIAVGQTSNILS